MQPLPRLSQMSFSVMGAGLLLLLCSANVAQAALPAGVTQPLVLTPTAANPRNSEGDFVRLRSGRILFVYTHFTGGAADHAAAVLCSRYSDDNGRTWSERDEPVVGKLGQQNVMSVSLLRLADGRSALFYLLKNGRDDCRPHVQFSGDEAATWSDPQPCVAGEAYLVLNNNRAVQLSRSKSGRIVLPVARHDWKNDKSGLQPGIATCYYSDDNGITFHKSESDLYGPPGSQSGLQEPLVVELNDGSLLMLCRTDRGCQYRSTSRDGGTTWSPAEPTDILSPLSPASVARIPATGDLLMVWNDHSGQLDPSLRGKRTPFTVAVSKDDGRTWTLRKTLYDAADGWYCYTAIAFVENQVLLGHCAGRQAKGSVGLATTVVTCFGLDWLYERR